MSGLRVVVELVPSRREWMTAAARFFCDACATGLAMGGLRRWQRPDHDLG
jgi:hypothetical protein